MLEANPDAVAFANDEQVGDDHAETPRPPRTNVPFLNDGVSFFFKAISFVPHVLGWCLGGIIGSMISGWFAPHDPYSWKQGLYFSMSAIFCLVFAHAFFYFLALLLPHARPGFTGVVDRQAQHNAVITLYEDSNPYHAKVLLGRLQPGGVVGSAPVFTDVAWIDPTLSDNQGQVALDWDVRPQVAPARFEDDLDYQDRWQRKVNILQQAVESRNPETMSWLTIPSSFGRPPTAPKPRDKPRRGKRQQKTKSWRKSDRKRNRRMNRRRNKQRNTRRNRNKEVRGEAGHCADGETSTSPSERVELPPEWKTALKDMADSLDIGGLNLSRCNSSGDEREDNVVRIATANACVDLSMAFIREAVLKWTPGRGQVFGTVVSATRFLGALYLIFILLEGVYDSWAGDWDAVWTKLPRSGCVLVVCVVNLVYGWEGVRVKLSLLRAIAAGFGVIFLVVLYKIVEEMMSLSLVEFPFWFPYYTPIFLTIFLACLFAESLYHISRRP